MLAACDARGIALVPLVAPDDARRAPRARSARGRAASSTRSRSSGTTGERDALAEASPRSSRARRRAPEVPVALGFGIATPEQARRGRRRPGADGVIVGTRLVRAAAEADDPPAAVGELVGELAGGPDR